MPRRGTVALARFTARLFARGVFAGLLVLALTVAGASFLTACKCNDFTLADQVDKRPPQMKDSPAPGQPTQPEGK